MKSQPITKRLIDTYMPEVLIEKRRKKLHNAFSKPDTIQVNEEGKIIELDDVNFIGEKHTPKRKRKSRSNIFMFET